MKDKVWKALGDPRRIQLLQLMSERSCCVRALARMSRLTESAVSQHLKVLREAGLVCGVKIGYHTHYRVEPDAIGEVIDALEALRSVRGTTCDGPFYGCPESEYVRCESYVPPEKRNKENQ